MTELLTPARIRVPLSASTKQTAIEEMIDLLVASGDVQDRQRALQAVMDREKTRTTGIGNALAIPHGRTNSVRDLVVAFGKTSQPVEFESIDGKPVSMIILLLSPLEQTGLHIQALAHVARMMSLDACRKALLNAATADEVVQILRKHETAEK